MYNRGQRDNEANGQFVNTLQLSDRRYEQLELWIQMFHRRPISSRLLYMKEPINDQTLPPCAHSSISKKVKKPIIQRLDLALISLVYEMRCIKDL